jgi:hypothetical protein
MSLLWQGTVGDVFLKVKLSEYRICPQGRTKKLQGKEDFFDDKCHKTSMVVFFLSCVFILISSGPTMIVGPGIYTVVEAYAIYLC